MAILTDAARAGEGRGGHNMINPRFFSFFVLPLDENLKQPVIAVTSNRGRKKFVK